MKRILFLYSELAGYFMACVNELVHSGDVQVKVIHWPVNNEAPFDFGGFQNIELVDRGNLSYKEVEEMVHQFNPELIVCSGWIDKDYVKICKKLKKQATTVVALDNHWTGQARQQLARIISPFSLKKTFDFAWVPGKPQHEYATRLGFRNEEIATGFYCADQTNFSELYNLTYNEKETDFPKAFLYFGRYVHHKGIFSLWDAFIELFNEGYNNWKLICVGTGELYSSRVQHEAIEHLGFIQPENLLDIAKRTGVFVLPSLFEPWGVVAQEFAIAGYPMICSTAVGAATQFLEEGGNGFSFNPKDKDQLKVCMKKVMDLPDKQLVKMAKRSHELGKEISHEIWVETIKSFIPFK